jgi:antitoxin (DNA-binding transcriptional repressor) of toxin-antitoxin stability system
MEFWPTNGYIPERMSAHSVAEAKNQLSELIDRALNGEEVVITRHGRPVVQLEAIPERVGPASVTDLDWLAERRIGRSHPVLNAGELLRKLRDEQER